MSKLKGIISFGNSGVRIQISGSQANNLLNVRSSAICATQSHRNGKEAVSMFIRGNYRYEICSKVALISVNNIFASTKEVIYCCVSCMSANVHAFFKNSICTHYDTPPGTPPWSLL